MLWKLLFAAAGIAAAIVLWAIRAGTLHIPERFNPWAELDIEAPPNMITRFKLSRLSNDAELCHRVLATAAMRYERLSDRDTGPRCGFRNAVRIDRMQSEVNEAFSLTCRAAVSLALWERHVLQPAAREHFGRRIARIEHFGSYACRNVYGRANTRRSQHATAEALDVAGFTLEGGERIRVLNDWTSGDQASVFLHDVRDGACRFFDGVLGPDYNEAHRDHFHLDRGPHRVCR